MPLYSIFHVIQKVSTFTWDWFGLPVAIETYFTNISCGKHFGDWKIIKEQFLNLPQDTVPSHQDSRLVYNLVSKNDCLILKKLFGICLQLLWQPKLIQGFDSERFSWIFHGSAFVQNFKSQSSAVLL